MTWSWTFGDGGSGSGKNVTHKYTQAGKYTVKLTITADHNETASTTVAVTVKPKCWDKQLAYGEAQRAVAIAQQRLDRAQAEVERLQGEYDEARAQEWKYAERCRICTETYQPWLQGMLCREDCKKADEWKAKKEQIFKELKEAKQILRQKERELKEAKRRAKEAWEAWQRCKGTDYPYPG